MRVAQAFCCRILAANGSRSRQPIIRARLEGEHPRFNDRLGWSEAQPAGFGGELLPGSCFSQPAEGIGHDVIMCIDIFWLPSAASGKEEGGEGPGHAQADVNTGSPIPEKEHTWGAVRKTTNLGATPGGAPQSDAQEVAEELICGDVLFQ